MTFAKEHWMLLAAAVMALASMAAVPPDGAYLSYFDWETIGCLFCVLAMANAFRRIGALDKIARSVIGGNANVRVLALAIVLVTAAFSMAFTNDVALIMMLPLSATMLVGMGEVGLIPVVFSLQGLAANLCGMITPFGNPQNLYLYSRYHLGFSEFLGVMAFPFFISLVGVVLATWFLSKRATDAGSGSRGAEPALAAASTTTMYLDRRRMTLYSILFVMVLLAVFRIMPLAIAVVIVVACLLVADRGVLKEVDYGLLLTFVCFFVFSGNIARLPHLEGWLTPLMGDWGLLVSALTSQLISNVPAAVILSNFTEAWQPLLVGVNIGGAGTFVGSLASLIVIRYFELSRKVFAPMRAADAPSMQRFLLTFAALNMAFFVVLLALCQGEMIAGF